MYTLIFANKNYSSWSLRPWLLLRQAGIPFSEHKLLLGQDDISKYSPSGRIPVLQDGDKLIWDSLAIMEYLAETFPEKNLWPRERDARAIARSISAEMHAGFSNLRTHMTMNCRGSFPGKGRTPEVDKEIQRIQNLWQESRAQFGAGGPFLFGQFSIADAMYAPVVSRFITYGVALTPTAKNYVEAIHNLPAMQEWLAAAQAEPEVLTQYEMYRDEAEQLQR